MKRAMVFALALAVAVVLIGDTTASARERGGRKSRGGDIGSTYYYYTYTPTTRVVYDVVPYEVVYPTTYYVPTTVRYVTTPVVTPAPTVTPPTTPATTTLTPEMITMLQTLKAAGYVK